MVSNYWMPMDLITNKNRVLSANLFLAYEKNKLEIEFKRCEYMNNLRQWLLDLFYEYHVRCDETVEELVDDIESIIEDAGYVKSN